MTGAADGIAIFAPAKINLTLQVTGRRVDGYHTLESLVVFAGIGDVVTVAPADGFAFEADGPFAPGLPTPDADLAVRAARLLAARAGRPLDVTMRLTKNLPLASGIGGGSADAVAAARALCRLWRLDFAPVPALLSPLGADMAVCAAGTPHWLAGIGAGLAGPRQSAGGLPDAGRVCGAARPVQRAAPAPGGFFRFCRIGRFSRQQRQRPDGAGGGDSAGS